MPCGQYGMGQNGDDVINKHEKLFMDKIFKHKITLFLIIFYDFK